MGKKSNSKQHNINLLDNESLQKKYKNKKNYEIIDLLLMESKKTYKEQQLQDGIDTKGFQIRLFFYKDINKKSKLSSFCDPFVCPDQEIVTFRQSYASSIMFIYNDTNIFTVTTGQGFRVIGDFCLPKFGLLVISAYRNFFRVTSLDSNDMSSIVHSNKTIYANEVDMLDIESLDTVFKEISGRLNDTKIVHDLLDLEEKSTKKSLKVSASKNIKFGSSMSLDKLLHLLEILNRYNYSKLNDTFNLISPIDDNNPNGIASKNKKVVIEKMYKSIVDGTPLGFDIFNRATNDFIEAETYTLMYNNIVLSSTEDIEPISFIKSAYEKYLGNRETTISTFTEFVESVKLVSKKDEREDITCDKLFNHISGEIEVDNKNYYIFYGDFYLITESYNIRLNQSLENKLLKERFVNHLQTKWEPEFSEDDFNEKVSNEEGYIHLHKIKPEYIEFADLMKIEEDGSITIIHVKDGFDDDMRALDRQVELSIKRLFDLKNNNTDYMRKLYKNASSCQKGRNITKDFDSEDSFIEAMRTKEIHYIIAIHPPKENLLENKSNIAKHCLNALILRCFNHGVDLKINVIK